MLRDKKTEIVYLEVIFSDMYQKAPMIDEVYAFIAANEMALVLIYDMHYRKNRVAWTDALSISSRRISRIENIRG
jgi:hypothetical protein